MTLPTVSRHHRGGGCAGTCARHESARAGRFVRTVGADVNLGHYSAAVSPLHHATARRPQHTRRHSSSPTNAGWSYSFSRTPRHLLTLQHARNYMGIGATPGSRRCSPCMDSQNRRDAGRREGGGATAGGHRMPTSTSARTAQERKAPASAEGQRSAAAPSPAVLRAGESPAVGGESCGRGRVLRSGESPAVGGSSLPPELRRPRGRCLVGRAPRPSRPQAPRSLAIRPRPRATPARHLPARAVCGAAARTLGADGRGPGTAGTAGTASPRALDPGGWGGWLACLGCDHDRGRPPAFAVSCDAPRLGRLDPSPPPPTRPPTPSCSPWVCCRRFQSAACAADVSRPRRRRLLRLLVPMSLMGIEGL